MLAASLLGEGRQGQRLLRDAVLGIPPKVGKMAAAQDFLGQPAVLASTSTFNFNFGAGIELRLWGHFGLRLDVRDHLSGIPRFGLPETAASPGSPFFPIHGRAQDFEITTGLIYYFLAK